MFINDLQKRNLLSLWFFAPDGKTRSNHNTFESSAPNMVCPWWFSFPLTVAGVYMLCPDSEFSETRCGDTLKQQRQQRKNSVFREMCLYTQHKYVHVCEIKSDPAVMRSNYRVYSLCKTPFVCQLDFNAGTQRPLIAQLALMFCTCWSLCHCVRWQKQAVSSC